MSGIVFLTVTSQCRPNEIPILDILLLAYGRIQRDANAIVFARKDPTESRQAADMSFKFRVPNYANKIIFGLNRVHSCVCRLILKTN